MSKTRLPGSLLAGPCQPAGFLCPLPVSLTSLSLFQAQDCPVHSTPHPESAQRLAQSRWQPGSLVQNILLVGHTWSSFFVGMIQGLLENPCQPEDRDFPTGFLFTLSQATASSWDPLLRSPQHAWCSVYGPDPQVCSRLRGTRLGRFPGKRL